MTRFFISTAVLISTVFMTATIAHGQTDSTKKKLQLLDNILSSKHFTISVYSSGCFHYSISKYDFYEAGTTWTMEYREIQSADKDFKLIYKIKLLPADISTVKKALTIGLTRKNDDSCTSTENYTITSDTNKIKFTDGTCAYKDFSNWTITLGKRERIK